MLSSDNRIILPLSLFLIALSASIVLVRIFQNNDLNPIEEDIHPYPEILNLKFQFGNKENIRLGDLGDEFHLIYFGSIYGSEIYPIAFRNLGKITGYKFNHPLTSLFFTLDLERDSDNLIQSTIQLYCGSIKFLKGEKEAVNQLTEKFGVRFQFTELPHSKLEYTYDINPWIYLTTKDFRILGAYPAEIRIERLKMEIEAHMKRFPSLNY